MKLSKKIALSLAFAAAASASLFASQVNAGGGWKVITITYYSDPARTNPVGNEWHDLCDDLEGGYGVKTPYARIKTFPCTPSRK